MSSRIRFKPLGLGRAMCAALLCVSGASVAHASTYTVTNTGDAVGDGKCDSAGSGDGCSLREAVAASNGHAGPDSIRFASSVRGTIGLTRIGDSDGTYGDSALLVSDSLNIAGPGAAALTVLAQSGGDYRLLRVGSGASLTISGLTLADGIALDTFDEGAPTDDGDGGAILNSQVVQPDPQTVAATATGRLTVLNCLFRGNISGDDGGAIYSAGPLTVRGSQFTSNNGYHGGAIAGSDVVGVDASTFSANYADEDGGAIQTSNEALTLTVTRSSFDSNYSDDYGGAIDAEGRAQVETCSFSNNSSYYYGGALYSYHPVTVLSSTFQNNGAYYSGGAIYADDTARILNSSFEYNNTDDDGGAVYADENVLLFNVSMIGNNADGYGGAVYAYERLALSGGSFSDNTATDDGGALFLDEPATILNATFTDNLSNDEGGAIYSYDALSLSNTTFTNNSSNEDGGALYHDSGVLTLSLCTFRGNSSLFGGDADGGAIYANGDALVARNSLFANNRTSDEGGGVKIETSNGASFDNCTFSGNVANEGAGLDVITSTDSKTVVRLRNCTLSGNSARTSGGGLYTFRGNSILENCTVTQNRAARAQGGGLASYGDELASTLLRNTIVSGNLSSDLDFIPVGSFDGSPSTPLNTFRSAGNNLVGTGNALAVFNQNDIISSNPGLAPLANNGGPTPTHALLANSPAIDKAQKTALPRDQRGQPRPFDDPAIAPAPNGDNSDIGAYEAQSALS